MARAFVIDRMHRAGVYGPDQRSSIEAEQGANDIAPLMAEAAWHLCRIGILRPGFGNEQGYFVTTCGRTWVVESHLDNFIPTEPTRLGEILQPFHARFGDGFYGRAQEAVRCYNAHAYLACCAMCGAAAESILLALAIYKDGSEENVLKLYHAASGRRNLESLLVGGATGPIQTNFKEFLRLLAYWRDESAHGKASKIVDDEAYVALMGIYRFAVWADGNWTEITKK